MTLPIDLVLSRLEPFKLRSNGRDRWRSCCPAHGGKNASALSVGIGRDDSVLLKCWQGCGVDELAGALGLELHDLFPPRPSEGQPPIQRRRLLTAHQALDLLEQESGLVRLCASDIARGEVPDEATRDRLLLAAARISMFRDEVQA